MSIYEDEGEVASGDPEALVVPDWKAGDGNSESEMSGGKAAVKVEISNQVRLIGRKFWIGSLQSLAYIEDPRSMLGGWLVGCLSFCLSCGFLQRSADTWTGEGRCCCDHRAPGWLLLLLGRRSAHSTSWWRRIRR